VLAADDVEQPCSPEVFGHGALQSRQGEAHAARPHVLCQLEQCLGRGRVHIGDRFQIDDDPARGRVGGGQGGRDVVTKDVGEWVPFECDPEAP
jgi:hypothetical protein